MRMKERCTDIMYLQACVDALANNNNRLSKQLAGAIILQGDSATTPIDDIKVSLNTIEMLLKKFKEGETYGTTEHLQLKGVHCVLSKLIPESDKVIHKLDEEESTFDQFVAQVFVKPLAELK